MVAGRSQLPEHGMHILKSQSLLLPLGHTNSLCKDSLLQDSKLHKRGGLKN